MSPSHDSSKTVSARFHQHALLLQGETDTQAKVLICTEYVVCLREYVVCEVQNSCVNEVKHSWTNRKERLGQISNLKVHDRLGMSVYLYNRKIVC